MRILFRIINMLLASLVKTAYLIFGIAVLTFISYLFAHKILDNSSLVGNDSVFALGLIYWFDKFYPNFPIWYPIQGMGVSLLYSYPMLTTFLTLFIKNISSFTAVEIFRVLAFSTFPLTALGIYFLAWTRLKNQTVGLIAGVFFLLSQASWVFQVRHGIFAQSFSLIFVAPTFLFFDLLMEGVIKGEFTKKILYRFFLGATVIFLALTTLSHAVTGTILIAALLIWGILRLFLFPKIDFSFGTIIRKLAKAVAYTLIVIVLSEALAGFWFIPFGSYTALANREGLNTFSLGQLQEVSLHISSLLGTGILAQDPFRYDYFFFATPVLIFFVVGFIGSLISKNKTVIIFSLISIIFVSLTTVPIYFPILASMFKFFFTAVYFRGLIPAFIFIPIVSAFGVWFVSSLVFVPILKLLDKKTPNIKNSALQFLAVNIKNILFIVISFFAVGLTYWSIKNLAHTPPVDPKGPGIYNFDAYGPSLSNDFDLFINDPKSFLKTPKISVKKTGLEVSKYLLNSLDKYGPFEKNTIVDVSPFAAGGEVIKGVGLVDDGVHYANLYHFFASIIHGMWGYQQGVFYGSEKLYKSPNLLKDLSDWYGIKYTLLTPGFDPFEKYKSVGWKPAPGYKTLAKSVDNSMVNPAQFEIWEYKEEGGLTTLTNRPVVLAIGDFKKGFYDHVFRSANLGALPYKDAFLVEGKKSIDDYSLSELKNFNGLFLHGYSYGMGNGAWDKVKKFVEEGGVVFVDTGWQYVAKDWGTKSLPSVFPVARTTWENIGTTWEGVQIDRNAVFGIDISKFDPPVWGSDPWGMSVARRSDLKENAVPILYKDDLILMASADIGKGKIIWSGWNMPSHVTSKMNEEEAAFLGKVIRPALKVKNYQDFKTPFMERKNPDQIKFTFSQSQDEPVWFLFRESYSPYWNASLISGDKRSTLSIYRGGPGFVLLRLPEIKEGDILDLKVDLSFKDGVGSKIISLLSLFFLIVFILIGNRLIFFVKPHHKEKIKNLLTKKTGGFKIHSKIAEDEEDY